MCTDGKPISRSQRVIRTASTSKLSEQPAFITSTEMKKD